MTGVERDSNSSDTDSAPAARGRSAGPSAADLEILDRLARELAVGIERALPEWVVRSVIRVYAARTGQEPDESLLTEARLAGAQAAIEIGGRVRSLLLTDVDEQTGAPLSVLRGAVTYPTSVLASAGVEPVERDEFSHHRFPDDLYDLAIASFADLDPALHEPGLMWGAAKAHIHLARRRAEGRR